ncbi:MAG: chemotaxis protein CheX [Lachnospiraceae bacterium]|nr:chemotaxis protein CheX [Lachnospiraceae bacterium]
MYTQFLGNYLLNKGYVTKEQLIEALQYQKTVHLKLGVLAIHAGYMTASQVEQIHIMQTHKNERFGELAVEAGFLTQEQVDFLLSSQKPDYLLLSQALVDKGYMTTAQFEKAMMEYQSEYEITENDFTDEQSDKVMQLIQHFYKLENDSNSELFSQYITLLFNNIIRFIGKDFTPHEAVRLSVYPTDKCVTQKIQGEFSTQTAIDMNEDSFIAFASRYAGEEFTDNDEYVQASVEDFVNLNNGLYVVNLSNESSIELSLEPPISQFDTQLNENIEYFQLPVTFPFGTVNFIITKTKI